MNEEFEKLWEHTQKKIRKVLIMGNELEEIIQKLKPIIEEVWDEGWAQGGIDSY